MLRRLFWLCAVLSSVCGCSEAAPKSAGAAASIENKTGSFLNDYLASLTQAKPAAAISVAGDWRGVLFCASGAYPLDFAIEQDGAALTGAATISAAIGDAKRPTPFYAEHRARVGTGEYGASHQTLSWMSPIAPDADLRTARGLDLQMMLAPENGNAALIAASEVSGARARSQRSCQGVALRSDGMKKIDAFIATSAAIRRDRRAVVQGSCPAKYKAWLESGLAGEDAFADASFAGVFGKPFRDMEAEPLLQASAVMGGSCMDGFERSQRIAATRQAAALRNYREYDASNRDYLRTEILDEWRAWIDAELARGAPIDQTAVTKIRTAPRVFAWRDHPDFRAFDKKIAALFDTGKEENRNVEFAQRIERAKDDFRALVKIRLAAQSRGDIDMEMVARGLDYYLEGAARRFADETDAPRDAIYMAAWTAQQENGAVCPAASVAACKKTVAVFRKRLDVLARDFAKEEMDAFDALSKNAAGLDGLASLVAFEQDLTRKYANLLPLAAFEKSAPKRRQARHALQKKNAREIRAALKASKTAPQIREIEARYFAGDDIDAGAVKPVKADVEKALAGTTPFAGIAGAAYFNALYNQDFAALRALDRDYTDDIRPLMAFSAQQVVALGPLIDAFSGQERGTTAADIAYGIRNMSVLYAVLGEYLVRYEETYGKCLRPDARTVEISKRVDTVTTDRFGNEIRRIEGWTNRDYYRVNPEFADHVDTLFDAAAGDGRAQLFDMLLNDAKITTLRRDATRLMATHDCASPEVKQLEEGFLAYDLELRRR